MKVLELCTSPGIGGLELYMVRSCNHLAAMGESVIAVIGSHSRMRERLLAQQTTVIDLDNRFPPLPLLAARELARIIDENDVEAVHLHWGKDFPLAVLAKRFSRRRPRLVYTRQMQLTRPKQDFYHRMLYRHLDAMLTITEQLAERARDYLPAEMAKRVHTLYYGVAGLETPLKLEQREGLRRQWGMPEEALVVGLFARIEEYKGQHLLIEAVARAKAEGIPLYGVIVGHSMDDTYLERIKALVEQKGLQEQIHFEGFTDDIQSWMQACDVVALTTVEETFGLVLVEAMRAGVAVVGSDRGGVPEIIRHGENGLLFRSGDAADLYTQLVSCARDVSLRKRLAAAGKSDADERFDEQQHFRSLRDYLRPES